MKKHIKKHYKRVKKQTSFLYAVANYSDLSYEGYHIGPDDLDLLHSARKLHADSYIARGVISKDQLDEAGLMNESLDPYVNRSDYFCVVDKHGQVIVSARFIRTVNEDLNTLQPRLETMQPKLSDEVLDSLDIKNTVEFASLVKQKDAPTIATLYIYRSMLAYSLRNNYKHWFFGLNSNINQNIGKTYGDALIRLGDSIKLGNFAADFVPYYASPHEVFDKFIQQTLAIKRTKPVRYRLNRRLVQFFLDGIPVDLLAAEDLELIKQLKLTKYSRI